MKMNPCMVSSGKYAILNSRRIFKMNIDVYKICTWFQTWDQNSSTACCVPLVQIFIDISNNSFANDVTTCRDKLQSYNHNMRLKPWAN